MGDHQPPSVQRRTLMRGAAWSVPVIAVGGSAPTASASGPQECYTGNLSGTISSIYTRPFVAATTGGVTWRRFDYIATLTGTYAEGIVNTLNLEFSFMWSGPQANNANGPWTAATWNNATGFWTSNRAETVGKRMFISNYQTDTPAPRTNFLQYTLPGTLYPLATASGNPPGATTAASTATINTSDDVYVVPVTPLPITAGSVATARFSIWVEAGPNNGVMSHGWRGNFWGDGCDY